MIEYKELQKIIKLAKKSGIKNLKLGEVELNFIEDAVRPKSKSTSPEEIKDTVEDEMKAILWSVPDLDPLAGADNG